MPRSNLAIVRKQPARRVVPNNLPAQPTPLIGREQAIASAVHLLQWDDVRLLVLTGPGGVGKTRLGLQIAVESLPEYEDGVYFVQLAHLDQPELVLSTIAHTLSVRDGGEKPVAESLKAYLHGKRMLLLLDNFEQVAEAGVQLVELLEACPHLKVLITSRSRLHLRWEHELPVPPLALPEKVRPHNIEAFTRYAAIALFVERARAARPDFQLSSANAQDVAELCSRLDGLPLAIELLAAHSRLLSPRALLTRLTHPLHLVSFEVRDMPARHRSLEATIEWSYHLLNPQEQRLFRQLSVFVGTFDLKSAEGVCAEDRDREWSLLADIESLVDKNLLSYAGQQDEGEPRLSMLQTIREYAMATLVGTSEAMETGRRHAECYLALAEEIEPHLKGAEQGAWMDRLELEHGNFRAALRWAKAHDEAEICLRLAIALGQFWEVRAHQSESEAHIMDALSMEAGSHAPTRGKALIQAGRAAYERNAFELAISRFDEGLSIFRELGDQTGIADALNNSGRAIMRLRDFERARPYHEESLAIYRALGDRWKVATALNNLGNVATDPVEATGFYEESLALKRDLDDKEGIAATLYNLGNIYVKQGNYARAEACFKESVAICRASGLKNNMPMPMIHLAEVLHLKGSLAAARRLYEEIIMICAETKNESGLAVSQHHLAYIAAREGDLIQAAGLFEQSMPVFRDFKYTAGIAGCLVGFAGTVLASGDVPDANRRAANLLGASDALLQATRAQLDAIDRAARDTNLIIARARLGEKTFAEAHSEGMSLTPEQALAAARNIVSPSETFDPAALARHTELSKRELEVLRLLALGLTDAQVASQLHLSRHTVNAHCRNIYAKLGVDSRSRAARYAVEHSLIN